MTWPPPGRITGCDRCDDHDVKHPDTLNAHALEMHRAGHELVRPIERFMRYLCIILIRRL